METFVVRVWGPSGSEDGVPSLCGTVEHVGTARSATFTDEGALLSFLGEILGAVETETGAR